MADYVGNGRVVGKYKNIKIGLRASDLPKPNDRGYINLVVGEKKDKPGEYWVKVDDYVPNQVGKHDDGNPF